MLKEALIFAGGLIAGAIGASYLAGVNEGRTQALNEQQGREEQPKTNDSRSHDTQYTPSEA